MFRIIVKEPIEEDLFDGQVLQKLIEKLEDTRIEVAEVAQSEEGQRQKLRITLDEINHILDVPQWQKQKWSAEVLHSKNLMAILHLLVALARHYRAPMRLPEKVSCPVTVVQKRDGVVVPKAQMVEELTGAYDDWGQRQEQRDAFDTLFEHAPEKLSLVKKKLLQFVNQHLGTLNLEVTDLDSQFHDGVYMILLMGLLEGYFVPLHAYHPTPTSNEQKARNVTLAFDLMRDAGLPAPKARAEGE